MVKPNVVIEPDEGADMKKEGNIGESEDICDNSRFQQVDREERQQKKQI